MQVIQVNRNKLLRLEDHPDLLSLADQVPEAEDLMDQEDDAPIVRLINALLSEAIRVNAHQIFISNLLKKLSVRLRVDGQLREIVQPRRELAPLLVSRIKVMAKLDIAEKRIPQDGRISLRLAGREVDVRVSTLPSSHGERVVMRLLDKQAGA
jgi:general secretion pathway protein E